MATLLNEPQSTSMKRVAMASFVGSAIEYYDFYIYGTAAALVFPTVFFPHLGTTLATVASMATFVVAFASRPAGAAFFGHFGDRLGRKATLTAPVPVRFDPEVLEVVKRLAEADGRSVSSWVRRAVDHELHRTA